MMLHMPYWLRRRSPPLALSEAERAELQTLLDAIDVAHCENCRVLAEAIKKTLAATEPA